jgi:hypothetical protein
LAATTVRRYGNIARRFLQEQASAEEGFEPAGLSGAEVNAFLLCECGRVSAGSAKGRVAELRSILSPGVGHFMGCGDRAGLALLGRAFEAR